MTQPLESAARWWFEPLRRKLGFDLDSMLCDPRSAHGEIVTIEDWLPADRQRPSRHASSRIDAAVAIRSGQLDSAHDAVQKADDPDGMLWHAIIHRLDGDLDNSSYWYRRVGVNPIQKSLVRCVLEIPDASAGIASLIRNGWSSERWIELHRIGMNPADRSILERIAICEWEALFERAWRIETD